MYPGVHQQQEAGLGVSDDAVVTLGGPARARAGGMGQDAAQESGNAAIPSRPPPRSQGSDSTKPARWENHRPPCRVGPTRKRGACAELERGGKLGTSQGRPKVPTRDREACQGLGGPIVVDLQPERGRRELQPVVERDERAVLVEALRRRADEQAGDHQEGGGGRRQHLLNVFRKCFRNTARPVFGTSVSEVLMTHKIGFFIGFYKL